MKSTHRILGLFLSILMLLSILTPNFATSVFAETDLKTSTDHVPCADTEYTLGDVDRDGKITVKDATLIQKHLASLATFDEAQLSLADVNRDDNLNIKDATAIQKRLANILDINSIPEVSDGYKRCYFYMPSSWKNEYAYIAGVCYDGSKEYLGEACLPTGYATEYGTVYYCDIPNTAEKISFNNFIDPESVSSDELLKYALQTLTVDISSEGMIFIVDYSKVVTSIYTGKTLFNGEWFYYYGNGEYGRNEVKVSGEVYTDEALNWIYRT